MFRQVWKVWQAFHRKKNKLESLHHELSGPISSVIQITLPLGDYHLMRKAAGFTRHKHFLFGKRHPSIKLPLCLSTSAEGLIYEWSTQVVVKSVKEDTAVWWRKSEETLQMVKQCTLTPTDWWQCFSAVHWTVITTVTTAAGGDFLLQVTSLCRKKRWFENWLSREQ